MRCPQCDSYQTRVTSTRLVENETIHRRYRKCMECGARWITMEITVTEEKDVENMREM